jgi:glycerol-3-phosphate dehydrogenase
MTVEDLVLRRTGLVMAGDATPALIGEIAGIMAEMSGRDEAWQSAQVQSALRDPRIIMGCQGGG